MARFFTSDWHIGHRNIMKFESRPFADVDDMNNAIIANVLDTVGKRDELYVVGDVLMGKFEDSLSLVLGLRDHIGKLVLVAGNHDRISMAYQHKGDADAKRVAYSVQYQQAFHRVLWDTAPHFCMAGRHEIVLSHYPYDIDERHGSKYAKLGLHPRDEGLPLVHGHVHSAWAENGRQFNVGVDVRDFKPVHEEEIAEWIKNL